MFLFHLPFVSESKSLSRIYYYNEGLMCLFLGLSQYFCLTADSSLCFKKENYEKISITTALWPTTCQKMSECRVVSVLYVMHDLDQRALK